MNTILGYFEQVFGMKLDDDMLNELTIDTPCGQDCKSAIDAGKAMVDHAVAAFGYDERAQSIVGVTIEIIQCYVHG